MASSTVEDYIKHIFLLQKADDPALVPMGTIASRVGVVPGTATTMIKALAEANLVEYEPRVGVRLSEPGEKLALSILRRHRLIELFLHKVLNMDWSEVHEDAEELEHAISDRVLERIDRMLGHPEFDPHGDPIPTACGSYKRRKLQTLENCELGRQWRIARLTKQDTQFLQFAEQKGLMPDATIVVIERNSASQSISIQVADGEELNLGLSVAPFIQVR